MGSNRDWGVDSQSLTLPPFAGPNDPAIVIGPDIPADLIAYYATFSSTVIGAIIFRYNATEYDWIALIQDPGGITMSTGTAEAGILTEMTSTFTSGGVGMFNMGSHNAGVINVLQGSTFVIETDAGWQVDGKDFGRGLQAQVSSTASSAAVTAETTVLTLPAVDLAAGRCYEARIVGNWFGAGLPTAGDSAIVRIRRAGGGNIAVDQRVRVHSGGGWGSAYLAGQFQVTTTGTFNLVETLASTSANAVTDLANATGTARKFGIWDIGAAADFTNLPSI